MFDVCMCHCLWVINDDADGDVYVVWAFLSNHAQCHCYRLQLV